MKRYYWFFLAFGCGLVLYSVFNKREIKPEAVGEGSDNHLKREEWIREMHRTAPGVDWREMDDQFRQELYQERLPALQAAAREGRLKGSPMKSIADGYLTGQWVEKGSNNLAGRVHCVDIDFANDRIYAAAAGGQIWTGTINGKNWEALSDPYQISDIQFIRSFPNPDGSTRILAANKRVKMNYSDDQGITWHSSEGLSTYYRDYSLIRSVSQSDGTLFLLAYKSGYLYLFRSKDRGATFTRILRTTGSDKSDLWTNRFGTDSVYLIDKTQVYSLKDSTAWQRTAAVNVNFASSEINQLQLAGHTSGAATRLYVMYRLGSSSRFFGSLPDSTSLTYRGSLDDGPFMDNSFAVSTLDPNLLAFGSVNAFRSTDGGVTWREVNGWGEYYGNMTHMLHADIPEIEFFKKTADSEMVFVSTDGGSYLSDDQLATVTNISLKGLNISQYYSTYTHRTKTNVIYAGAQDQGFQKSYEVSDGIVGFEQTISGDYGHIVSGDGGKSMWTVYPGFAMYYPEASTSNGMSTLGFDQMNMKNQFWMPPLLADPYFPNRVFLAGGTSTTGCHLWHLDYRSGSITATELPTDFSNGDPNTRIAAMAVSPINPDYRYVLNSAGKFFASGDRGTTWTQSTNRGPDSHYFYGNSIVPSPSDLNTIWLAGSGYSGSPVWVSRDGGLTFKAASTGMKNSLIFEMVSNEDGSMLFAASEVGPWVYIANLNKWFDLSGVGAPQQTYWSVDYVPALRTARFGTYGRGIWDFRISTFSGAEESAITTLQGALQVYPNPCTDYLMVNPGDNLSEAGPTTITLYTRDGRSVLNINTEAPGPHRIDVSNLPSGVYVLSVQHQAGKSSTSVVRY